MKIYTKTGDLGETSLIGGVRVKKSNIRIDAYGTVDELNSWIGVIRNIDVLNNPLIFQNIQDLLFTVGSHLASHPEKGRMKLPEILESDIVLLENEIDKMELELAPLSHFVLPGSSTENGFCHVARTVCRRAERCTVELALNESVEPIVIRYLNRLSDYLFVLSRYITLKQNGNDIPWLHK
jgi:cob(I)alamin adenosyltransferase